jgi:hypothetical protein
MRRIIIAIILASAAGAAHRLDAQALTAPDCEQTLSFVASFVERNYAGAPDKIDGGARVDYDTQLGASREAARAATDDGACRVVLERYAAWFRDPHLSIGYRPSAGGESAAGAQPTPDQTRARFADRPRRELSEDAARAHFDQRRGQLHPVEGIWEAAGSNYRLAVVRDDDNEGVYEAVVLRADGVWWVPGQIKARFRHATDGTFESEFFMRDHSRREGTARVAGGVLRFSMVSPWARVYPDNPSGFDRAAYARSENERLSVRPLDDRTMLVQIPSFNGMLAPQIDSAIRANWSELTSRENLIIDLRSNGGGADYSWRPLIPLIYTDTMTAIGLAMRATPENVALLETYVAEHPDAPPELREWAADVIAEMRRSEGGYTEVRRRTHSEPQVLENPKTVAVIVDRYCASSCESFLFAAQQSRKVTIYGENTGGFLDYGNVMGVATPHPSFSINMPTARSGRLPERAYDNVGIDPHVRVPDDVLMWLEWVRAQLP